MSHQRRTIFGPLCTQVLVHRPTQHHVHEMHPPANTQGGNAEQPGQQRQIALPHIPPQIRGLSLRMGLLLIQAGREIPASAEDQPVQMPYDRPEHFIKESRKGMIITQEIRGIVTFQKGEWWNDVGKASCLQDGMRGRCISTIDGPPTIAQGATGSQNANVGPFAPGTIVMLDLFFNLLLFDHAEVQIGD
jgi:hypothetical protein